MMGNNRVLILIALGLVSANFIFFAPMYTGAIGSEDFARCDACHVQEHDEFTRTVVHKTIECTNCHNISEFGSDLYSHNATTFECTYCHTNQNASQFSQDAHNVFSNASNTTAIFTGRNELCVACHTGIELEIEWHRYNGTNITVSGISGSWDINYSVFGDNVTTNYTNYTY